jgi:O6-methylguanine-DNA--protein-cysteine methyltransferase
MSSKGGSSGGSSYQAGTSTTTLPDWVNSASQDALSMAQAYAQSPNQAYYPGQMVAYPTDDTQAAYQAVRNLQGQTAPAFDTASGAWSNVLGNLQSLTPEQQNQMTNSLYGNFVGNVYNPAQGLYGSALAGSAGLLGNYLGQGPATAQQVASNTAQLMNPYTGMVVAPTMQMYGQMIDQQMQQNAGQAANVGAFGGSRMGVQNAVAQAQGSLGASQYLGNLLSQGYNQALQSGTGIAEAAAQQGLSAQEYLAGQGMTAAQQLSGLLGSGYGAAQTGAANMQQQNLALGEQAAQQIPALALQKSAQEQKEASMLQTIGAAQQNEQQALLNSQMANYYTYQQDYSNKINEYLSALSSIPYGSTTSYSSYGTNSQNQSRNVASGVLGGAATGAAIGSMIPGVGTAIGAVSGGILGAL